MAKTADEKALEIGKKVIAYRNRRAARITLTLEKAYVAGIKVTDAEIDTYLKEK